MTDNTDRPQPQRQFERRPLKEAGYVEKGALLDALVAVPTAAAVSAVKAHVGNGGKKDK